MIDTVIPIPTDTAEQVADERAPKMSARDVSVYYGEKLALKGVGVDIHDDRVTAFIGPSGCGKSTFLRCLNRMNDTIESARITGNITLDAQRNASKPAVILTIGGGGFQFQQTVAP